MTSTSNPGREGPLVDLRVLDLSRLLPGGYGYTDEYAVSRMWREVAAARSEVAS